MTNTQPDYFAAVHAAAQNEEGRLHPLVTFMLMFLTNNGALLVFMYMMFDGFTILGAILIGLLLLSSVMLYRTS
ncbi:MAG: hypothetical protein AAFV33_07320 [Chloroflexota bacterium]